MAGTSGFEFLHRPYPYPREPFRLDPADRVAYEGRYFSIPAFGLLLDKRLFTEAADHPVASPITLYINRDAGLSSNIEPSLNASGYEVATPHYADYILDMRTLLEDVVALHAADSDYSSDQFFAAHMQRNRSTYDLDNSSASGTSYLEYVHPSPANAVPVAPSSTPIPGEAVELGALQFQDIDMDEVMWQPFARPKSTELGPRDIPTVPIFPAALPGGSLPTFTTLDKQKYGELGLDVSASGGVLVTGDGLTDGTSIKLITASGEAGAAEGDFVQNVPWALFPSEGELNRYYVTQNSGCISASGRQAIYQIPAGLSSDEVHLLDVSNEGSSGLLIQTWPANYHASSGIDPNGTAHRGVHTDTRLLYNLNEASPGNLPNVGRSLLNGKKVFGHFVDSATSSTGRTIGGALGYADDQTLYYYGGVSTPLVSFATGASRFDWATTGSSFYPVSWGTFSTTALEGRPGLFGSRPSTTYDIGDILSADTVVCRKYYAQWGYIDQVVVPAGQRLSGGGKTSATINYESHIFREGTDSDGNFQWVELDPPESPIFTTQEVKFFSDTYFPNNIFSFFLLRRPSHGFVHANGKVYFQWGENTPPRYNRLINISDAPRNTELVPPTARSVSTYVVGFFPSWKVRLVVTTNNQIEKPTTIGISPASSAVISFDPSIPKSTSDVNSYGPITWDDSTGLNYLYFSDNQGRIYFAKMDSSFTIIHINRVAATDAFLSGRGAILNI